VSVGDKAREVVQDVTGMWWPAADEDELRDAAKAWRDFADDVEDVTAAANRAARSLIEHNKGEAISAFDDPFWRRYYHSGHGWLQDLIDGSRDMAKALDTYADAVDGAKKKLEHELEIVGATLLAGTALAVFTAGISEGAAAAATAGVVELAGTLGVAVSTEIATNVGTTLATAAIAGVESVTVDLAVAQPIAIATGESKGFSLDEASDAALYGTAFGGAFGAAGGTAKAAAEAGGWRNLLNGGAPSFSDPRIPWAGLSYEAPPSSLMRLDDEWLTGARRRPRDILDDPAQTKWAEDAYEDFRQNPRDIEAINNNSRNVERANGEKGFTESEISDIKNHLFETEHPIEDYETGEVVTRKFDADAEIADAWIRLRSGKALPEDHVLLEHELTELNYLREHPGATYQEAHRVANETYNWQSKVPLDKREDFEDEW
jgi:hypothetical protein